MILTVSLICGVITLTYFYLTWTFDHWVKRNIPGPKPVVLVGNSPSNVSRKQSMFMDFHNIYKKYKDNSRFVGIFIMRNPQILVLDAGLSKDILIKNFRNFHYNYFAALIDKETDPIFLNNPFMLKGEEWKVKRSEITPAFTTSRFDHWVKRNIPGPKPVVLVGNFPSIVSRKQSTFMDFDNIYRKYKYNSRFVGIFNMRNPQILVLDAGLSKDILIKNFKNFHDNVFANLIDKENDPIFGNNPFMLKGEEWKERRAEITPAFTASRLNAMYPLIEQVCKDMVDYINKEIDKKSPDGIDTRELTAKFTTDVVSNCAFALDAESFKNSDAKIRQMGKKILDPSLLFFVYFIIIEVIPYVKNFFKMAFVKKDVEIFFTKIMRDAIDYRLKSKTNRVDFLHYLLSLREKKNLDDLQMVSHAITFFIDGFETSSVTMAFTLYELAKDKRVQDKLRAEIKEVESKGELNFDTVGEMPYLEQVINEAMRLNPPVAFSSKICTEDFKARLNLNDPSSEVIIKKGDAVNIPIYSIQRDPRYYENPDQFYPERFNPENGGLKDFKDKGAFLPFTDGPRICLGMKFAYVQIKAGLVEIIKNFESSLNPKTLQPLKYDPISIITLPVGGFWIDYNKL